MDERDRFSGFCILFTDGAILAALFGLFGGIESQVPQSLAPLPFALWAGAVSLFLSWFLRKERPLPLVVAVGVLLWCVGAGVVLPFSQLTTLTGWAFALVFLTEPPLRACLLELSETPPSERQPVNYVELSVIGTGLCLLFELGPTKLPPSALTLLLTAVLLNFLNVIHRRVSGGKTASNLSARWQGAVGLGLSAGAILGLAALFTAFGSLPARQGLTAFLGAVGYLLGVIGDACNRFFLWLISMLPDAEEGALDEMQQAAAQELPEMRESPLMALPPWVLPVLILLMILAAVVVFTVLMRKVRIKRVGGRRRPQKVLVRRPGFLHALGIWWQGAKARIRFWLRAARWRNSPQGMLVCLERWALLHRCPRHPGETHRAFLERLGGLPRFQEGATVLEQLSQALDKCYYAPGQRKKPVPMDRESLELLTHLMNKGAHQNT